jgi:hypothetical protein
VEAEVRTLRSFVKRWAELTFTRAADYRGYLRRHLVPGFGERALDRIEPGDVETYLREKLAAVAPKTVATPTLLHGLFGFAVGTAGQSDTAL